MRTPIDLTTCSRWARSHAARKNACTEQARARAAPEAKAGYSRLISPKHVESGRARTRTHTRRLVHLRAVYQIAYRWFIVIMIISITITHTGTGRESLFKSVSHERVGRTGARSLGSCRAARATQSGKSTTASRAANLRLLRSQNFQKRKLCPQCQEVCVLEEAIVRVLLYKIIIITRACCGRAARVRATSEQRHLCHGPSSSLASAARANSSQCARRQDYHIERARARA